MERGKNVVVGYCYACKEKITQADILSNNAVPLENGKIHAHLRHPGVVTLYNSEQTQQITSKRS